MSTNNICFCRETGKILCGYPLLSVAMNVAKLGFELATPGSAVRCPLKPYVDPVLWHLMGVHSVYSGFSLLIFMLHTVSHVYQP